MEINQFRRSIIFIFLGLVIAATNATPNKLLSDELIEECRQYEGNNNGIQRCLKLELREFCANNGNKTINGVEQVFCTLMKSTKSKVKVKRRQYRLIPLTVRERCRGIEENDDDDEDTDDCIQEELEAYCQGMEFNITGPGEEIPHICSCYEQQGRRNTKECIKEQKIQFCEGQDQPSFECKRIQQCGGAGNKRKKKTCVENLCNQDGNSNEFACKKLKCVRNASNRMNKRQCIKSLCTMENNSDEFLCRKLNAKTTRRLNRKMQQVAKPWKHMKSPIPKIVRKLCRHEPVEQKDDCILRQLENSCNTTKELINDDNLPTACFCIGQTNDTETIKGLKSCVKTHMLNYCQDENDDIERAFECRKLNQCEAVEDRSEKRQCIKKLCEENEFADSCHCKKRRRERKKCFKEAEEIDYEA